MDMHWKKECKRILDQMYNKDKGNMKRGGYQTPDSVFQQPVDTTKVYDYLHYVKHPMDLGTIRQALERGDIASPDDFIALVRSFLIRPKTVTCMYTQRKTLFVLSVRCRCDSRSGTPTCTTRKTRPCGSSHRTAAIYSSSG